MAEDNLWILTEERPKEEVIQIIVEKFSKDKNLKSNISNLKIKPIIEKLKILKCKVKIYDPYYKSVDVFGIKTEHNLIDALSNTDAIIIVTAHKEFHDLEPTFLKTRMKTPILVDSRGVVEQHAAKKAGLIFRGLGRGKI